MKRLAAGAIALLLLTGPASAGVYADDLTRCLVERTSPEDRQALVRWMFSAASAHPAVADISAVTPEALEASNRATAELMMRLLTEACFDPARKAIAYEGEATLQASFQVLGQVAGAELFASPAVAGALSGLHRFIDADRLAQLVEPPHAAPDEPAPGNPAAP